MKTQKYDISKTFKLSNDNIANIVYLQRKKGFKTDSECVRFCLNLATVLIKNELETRTLNEILENLANTDKE